MGFQVVFNTTQLGIPQVVLISAGEDTFVACGSTVGLLGVVDIPANLPGHAILWEQLTGTPVVLSNTDTLGTSYPFVERSDKTFRLWIDKGLPEQQFKDVAVFHTPLTRVGQRITKGNSQRHIPHGDFVVCNTISGVLAPFIPIPRLGQQDRSPCQPDGGPPTSGIDFDFSVTWTVPDSETALIPFLIQSELFYVDTGLPVPNSVYLNVDFPPGSVVTHSFFPGGENELKRYYVETTYSVADNIIKNQSCEVDYTTTALPALHVIDDNPIILGLLNPRRTILRYANSKKTTYDIKGTSFSGHLSNFRRLTPTVLSYTPYSRTNTTFSGIRINIIRFDSSGIGS